VWRAGMRLVTDPDQRPIKVADVPIGGVIHVIPEVKNPDGSLRADVDPSAVNGHHELTLNELAKAVVLVMRIAPGQLKEPDERKNWSVQGIVAYSKICTHVGCPIALLERTTNHLLCPCHQSTFDATDQCKVIFGPANRPLPQLPIAVDSEGYLIAQSDFTEPVGPSFPERG
jgi:ubiquinol-cytochrome c reductase iron-sulfur subunit